MQTWKLIVAGTVVHFAAFISVFDIYFSTPLIEGLTAHKSRLPPPAKRLVFIVADGLRADKTLMLQPDGSTPAPFIRSIAESKGAWGVSTAGIPTATRPGHVAMTAGFYEDPTSVAKDIGDGRISFDDVFQDTTYTWSWDSPQVLDKVAKTHQDKVFSKKFPGARKYLSGINPKDMDSWVFTEATNFINEAKHDKDLKEKMAKDKLLFFLHLGGIDHAGYIVRPNSPRYLQHLKYIDDGVKDIVEQFEEYFDHDGKTAFIFTSDHGMTNWGAHGDGMPDEIHCPLLVWGAGIRKPIPEDNLSRYQDTLSQEWSLTKWKRSNIEQPSLAPLMASLIGVTFPTNAIYPFPDGFLDIPDDQLFEIMFANLMQLLENYMAIEWYTHTGPLAFDFRSFQKLTPAHIWSIKTDLEALRSSGDYAKGIRITRDKIDLVAEGIQHYRLYSEVPLWIASFSSMFGWFCFCFLCLLHQHTNPEDLRVASPLMADTKSLIQQFGIAVFVFDVIVLFAQSTKPISYLHFLLPIPVWTCVIIKWYELGGLLSAIRRTKDLALTAGVVVFGLCIFIVSSYQRWVFPSLLVAFALWTYHYKRNKLDKELVKYWIGSLLILAFICGKPTGDRDLNYNLALAGGALLTIFAGIVHKQLEWSAVKGTLFRHFGRRYGIYQISKLAVTTLILMHSSYLTLHDIRTPLLIQVPSWIILIVSLLEPLIVNTDVQSRLTAIALGSAAPYLLLSIGQEPLCYLFVIIIGGLFIEVESHLTESHPIFLPRTSARDRNENSKGLMNGHSNVKQHKHTRSNDILMVQPTVSEWRNLDFAGCTEDDQQCKRMITNGDLRRCLFFMVMLKAGLYGSGHIISVNSFDVQDVFCFFTTHNPPVMGSLMVMKLLMHVFFIACIMRAVNIATFTSTKNYCLLCYLISNVIGMVAFACVTNTGTWTEIGLSVSRHLIYQCLGLSIGLMIGISKLITSYKITKR